MKQRCLDQKSKTYPDYGGRGIRVCERWIESFEDFLADVGIRPSDRHSIDRIDNDGHYEPGNVRWATRAEQQRNRRTNRWITVNGETRVLEDRATLRGIAPTVISGRLKDGWTPEGAVMTPKGGSKR